MLCCRSSIDRNSIDGQRSRYSQRRRRCRLLLLLLLLLLQYIVVSIPIIIIIITISTTDISISISICIHISIAICTTIADSICVAINTNINTVLKLRLCRCKVIPQRLLEPCLCRRLEAGQIHRLELLAFLLVRLGVGVEGGRYCSVYGLLVDYGGYGCCCS